MELAPFGIDVVVIEPGGIRTEWSGIAADKVRALSGTGPYAAQAQAVAESVTSEATANRSSPPTLIGRTITKATTARHPGPATPSGSALDPSWPPTPSCPTAHSTPSCAAQQAYPSQNPEPSGTPTDHGRRALGRALRRHARAPQGLPPSGTRYFLRAPEVGVQASGSRHDSRLLLSMITEVLSPGIAGRV